METELDRKSDVKLGKKGSSNICVISYDIIGRNMAGPGIRFYEFAKILSDYLDVTLVTPNKIDIDTEGFKARQYKLGNYKSLQKYVDKADTILIQGHILYYFPFLRNFRGKIIVDLYNPFNLESLEMFGDSDMTERIRIDKNNLNILKMQLSIGDFFICASEKQRDYWVGMLNAMGRINPYNYDSDKTLKNLIDIVPSGMPSQPPKRSASFTGDKIPGIGERDHIILWGGGIWNWLDPITPIKALWEITRNKRNIKMIFMGIKHPDASLPEMRKCNEAIKLSKELDMYEKFVFFNEWTPYDLRQTFLLDSDMGISIHQERIETEFSYRTRVMDYIWARLPVVTTEGDSIAKMVKAEKIGEVVKYGNTAQLARVMENMATNKSLREIYKKNLIRIAPRFYWENVTKPLVKYCVDPDYALDKKKIIELIDLQNSKISRIIKDNFEGCANVLNITSNKYKDEEVISETSVGKIFWAEIDVDLMAAEDEKKELDEIGLLKTKITERTKYEGIILNNVFYKISPKFFYDLVNVLASRLKKDGLLFFSIPEQRGLYKLLGEGKVRSRSTARIDDFTIEYILKNAGFEIKDKGIWDEIGYKTMDAVEDEISEIYGKNELFELFEVKMDRKNFEEVKLLGRFDILNSEELTKDKSMKGAFRRYIYLLSSMYFENLRKSYNQSMKAINNNIQIQINNEMNEINRKNRERLVLIYFNIFRTLYREIKSLGYDISSLREVLGSFKPKSKSGLKVDIDQKLEVLLRDLENIDRIMGLTISNKYYLAKKLRS
jgi:glycosyltransferase involved in cell wall biosynthesis